MLGRKSMGGDMDGWCFPSLDSGSRTVVLMGHTGNGKSATGNSILGKKGFESRSSLTSITSTVECLTTTFANGEVVNVIDTPGLFNSSVGPEFITKEIMKCIDMANDGIHSILLVLSVRTRFTEEECDAIKNLQMIFGPKITDYIVIVFTGADNLEKNQSLEELLSRGCPDALKKVLGVCKNRMVLFDNKTEDKKKKATQLQMLFGLVDKVIEENDGKPYTNAMLCKMKEVKEELNASNGRTEQDIKVPMLEVQKCYDEQFKRMMEMVEKLQQQLAEENTARLNAEKFVQDAQKRSEGEIKKLGKRLSEALKKSDDEIKEVRKNLANAKKIAVDAKAAATKG